MEPSGGKAVSQKTRNAPAQRGAHVGRNLRSLAICWAMASTVAVWAAEPPATANVEALDKAQAEQERLRKMLEGKPKAYEDKVMDATPLPAAPEPGSASAPEEGVRSFFSETRVDWGRSDSGLALRRSTELGQRIEARRETLNYGDFLLQGDFRKQQGTNLGFGSFSAATQRTSERLTLRNIAFPVTQRVFADTNVGDISSEVTDGLARTYRVSLGSSTVRGASTRIFSDTTDLRMGIGSRGTLAGGPYPGFERSQGELAWAGFSERFGDRLIAGVQASHATEVPATNLSLAGVTTDVDSVAASVGYGPEFLRDGDMRTRAIYLRSRTSADGRPEAQGLFVEGAARSGSFRHEYGVYSADPNLRYGDYGLISDNRGAYWRVDSTGLRFNWGLGLDASEQNPRHDPDRVVRRSLNVNANAQYRIDRDRLIGGSAVVLNSRNTLPDGLADTMGSGARSMYASAFYQTRFIGVGRTRFRTNVYRNETLVTNGVPATGEVIEWEQEWIEGNFDTSRPELTTTLGVAHDRSNGVSAVAPTAGLNFRVWPAADWTASGNLRYTASNSNLSTSQGLSGTVDTEHRMDGGWTVGASLSLNQARVEAAAIGGAQPVVTRSNDKFASVYLRWEDTRGTSFRGAALGGGGSVGAGSVSGVVFFDGNRDGEQQSGEAGVPNVEVLLDGRFRTTTDRTGRFVFPLVGSGHHQITLTLETVPLPWGAASDRGVSIDVPLRGLAETRVPVVRVGD